MAERSAVPALSTARLRKVPLLNAYVHDVTTEEALAMMEAGGLVLTLHPDMLRKLQEDRAFHDAFSCFDLVTCDSQILFFALKLMGRPVRERVSGSDLLPRFYMRHRADPAITMFLCGGAPGVPEEAARRINAKAGREIVVGTDSPDFGLDGNPAELERLLAKIDASGASVLVVALGGGRQEKFIVANRHRLPKVRLFLPFGGAVDYEAGTVRRPAPWVSNIGLEWLYRVMQNPRARWYRYFVYQPPVLWQLLRDRLGRYRDPFSGG
jgi:N-acetylglucosaminyldiphosphoundecaprenol N-acetyl-beta-D-mannosaminyltransferase